MPCLCHARIMFMPSWLMRSEGVCHPHIVMAFTSITSQSSISSALIGRKRVSSNCVSPCRRANCHMLTDGCLMAHRSPSVQLVL